MPIRPGGYLLLSPTFGMHQYTADLANRTARGVFGEAACHLVTTRALPHDRYSSDVHVHTPVTIHSTGFCLEGLRVAGLRQVLAALEQIDPAFLHITGVHAWNVLLVRLLRRRGWPVIHTLHDLDPHHGVRHRGLIRLWNRLIIGGADHILVHGQRYRRQLLQHGLSPDKVTCTPLLHLCFSAQRTHSLARHTSLLAPARGAQSNVLFFGRIEPYKGVDILLDAWRELASTEATLTLSGAVSNSVDLGELPPSVTLYNKMVGDDQTLAYLRQADLLVLPYRDATQSALIALAYYFGLPVIVTRTGALPEYVIEGETGWVVPPEDPDALAEALDHALSDRQRLREMGQAGRAWYEAQRVIEEKTLTAMYAKVAATSRRS